jgi:hypothetical protein
MAEIVQPSDNKTHVYTNLTTNLYDTKSTDLYGTIYIDNIQKAVVICLIIPTIFPFDAISSIKKYPDV